MRAAYPGGVLLALSTVARDYAWGSSTLIAELEGREPSGAPEAELWFGDHAGWPSRVEDGSGRTLDEVLGPDRRLPYLLKVLAAASALSIQAHPSKAQAEEGFAREEAAGIAADAPGRNYRDDNHKPEVIVALRDGFEALSGLRPIDATQRLLEALGDAAAPLRARLSAPGDGHDALRETLGWLLSGEASRTVTAIVQALPDASSAEFADELEVARRLAASAPDDPGVVVALLMNLVHLRRGEALFVPAGVLHAYLSGIGVEIMAASDNVLRGGLTPKHIDVDELLRVLDPSPAPATRLAATEVASGIELFAPPVRDFALLRARIDPPREIVTRSTAIVLCTEGVVEVRGGSGRSLSLRPGQALVAGEDESPLSVTGTGEIFVAESGA